ncbi:MAM and LDL-receptor class A domain-containing 2, partial [Paramuricea clavata]
NGNWGNWGEYGPPSKTCDEGFRTRFRKCNNPQPRGFGKPCQGSDRESFLFEFGRCVLKKLDTEFNRFSMGMWKHEEGTPGFLWKIVHQPSRDVTGDGYFLFADSNLRKREDQAKIISDALTPAPKVNRACLKFHYRMHGSGMGLLTVKIKRNSRKPKEVWSAYGDHGNKWVKSRVTLKSSVKFQVLFVAAIGTPQLSHFALDSIYVDNGPCKCQDEYQSCPEWEANGKCDDKKDNETYYWMAKNCKTSCNSCYCKNLADFKKCRRWAEEGYCSSHLTWMSANCQLSCRLCGKLLRILT